MKLCEGLASEPLAFIDASISSTMLEAQHPQIFMNFTEPLLFLLFFYYLQYQYL
jgi:hypothetical protein